MSGFALPSALRRPLRAGRRIVARAAGRRLALAGALVSALTFVVLASGCQPAAPHHEESYVFGTRIDVQVTGVSEPLARDASGAVLREFDRLHRAYHAWEPSELTRLNHALANGQTFTASAELAAMLTQAKAMAAAGDYLFDPGIGGLAVLWGFHKDEYVPALPDPAAITTWRAAHPSIGELRIDGLQISSPNRALAIDLGGYAKGYALDRAARLLRDKGVRHALINIGGNILALGDKNGTPWRIGIRDPRGSGQLAILELRDGEAIGTSGDYQRYFEVDGKRYNHLLDPRTGYPAAGTQAVTVLIPGGADAGVRSDALSKPLFIGGGADFAEYLRRLGVSHALRVDASGRIEVTRALAGRLDFGQRPPPVVLDP